MKKMAILLITLATFSCNNQPNNDPTCNNNETTSQVGTSKTENEVQPDTPATIHNHDFAYQPADKKTTQQPENFLGFSSFYKQFDKPAQTFTLKANEDKTITCEEGTKITIKSNCFVTESGNPVTGDIRFQVKEYYETSDILLANLTTTSNNDILETGGMLHIEAFYNGEKCQLKKEAFIEIAFPFKDKKNDMQLFTGQWNEDKINWTLEETTPVQEEEASAELFTVVETMPEFPGGQQKFMEYISSNIKYPSAAKENGIQGTVYIGFVINEHGNTENIRVLRGVEPSLDQEAISVVKKMPKWIPGKQKGEFVKVNMNIPIRFSLGGEGFNTNNIEYVKGFEKEVNDDNLSETKMPVVSQYLLSTSKLGWINCDRFYQDNNPKVDYFVDIGSSKQVDIKIVFDNIKSILTGSSINNKYTFANIPIGHSVTLVALKYENEQYYLAIKKTKISRNGEPQLEFEPVTMARLKTEMKKLNRI